jgi:hypothetical protein
MKPPDAAEGMIRIWSWNPGGGARSVTVPAELADEVRDQLRADGCITWVTRGVPFRVG